MKLILLLSLVTSITGLNCSNGLNQTSNLATATLPITLSKFVSVVGSFFNDSWYIVPCNVTVGMDNQIGSMRVFWDQTGTKVYNETLLVYISEATFFQQIWTGPGSNGASIDSPLFILGFYVEYLSGQSTCNGSAVIMNFGSEACVTNVSTATSMLTNSHVQAIQKLQTLLNIGNLTSCTTSASSIRSNSLFTGLISIMFGLSRVFFY
jgi:hypothetical protein